MVGHKPLSEPVMELMIKALIPPICYAGQDLFLLYANGIQIPW